MSQAEQAVLSCIFMDNQLAHSAVSMGVREDHFTSIANKQIWRTMQALAKEDMKIDIITVAEHLEARGALDAAGSYEYINMVEATFPDPSSLSDYVEVMRDSAVRRKIGDAGQALLRLRDSTQDVGDLLNEFNSIVRVVHNAAEGKINVTSAEVAIDALVGAMDSGTQDPGIKTGYHGIDGMVGGLRSGNLVIIAGRPGMGKTSLALNMLHMQTTRYGCVGGFFSLEMSTEELVIKILSSETNIPVSKIRMGSLSDSEMYTIRKAQRDIRKFPMFFEDSGGLTTDQLAAKARELHNTKGMDIMYVDYLQLMQSARRSGNRTEEVSQISRDLKKLAKELDIPIVAMSQLNRSVEGRTDKRPQLADLRESGSIEQDADAVIFVYRPGVYAKVDTTGGESEFIIAKNRSGPSGTVKAIWKANTNQFLNPS